MRTLKTLATLGLLTFSALAAAQWQWTDASGRKVYSDQPPPAEIPDKAIVRRPNQQMVARPSAAASGAVASGGQSGTPAVAANTAASGAAPAAAASKPAAGAGKDSELEKRKAAADAAEAAKKKEEEQKRATARAENCQRARSSLTSLQSGVRITRIGPNGERQFLSDEEKATESRRAQEIIQSECAPAR